MTSTMHCYFYCLLFLIRFALEQLWANFFRFLRCYRIRCELVAFLSMSFFYMTQLEIKDNSEALLNCKTSNLPSAERFKSCWTTIIDLLNNAFDWLNVCVGHSVFLFLSLVGCGQFLDGDHALFVLIENLLKCLQERLWLSRDWGVCKIVSINYIEIFQFLAQILEIIVVVWDLHGQFDFSVTEYIGKSVNLLA